MPCADTKRIGALVRKSLPPIDHDTLYLPWMRGRNRRGTRNLDHGAPGTSLHVEVRLRGHELGVFCGEHLREKGCGCGGGGGSGIGAAFLAFWLGRLGRYASQAAVVQATARSHIKVMRVGSWA